MSVQIIISGQETFGTYAYREYNIESVVGTRRLDVLNLLYLEAVARKTTIEMEKVDRQRCRIVAAE